VRGDTGHGCDLSLSEREKLLRGVGRVGWEGRNFLLLIETIWRMAPGLVPMLRQRARDPTLRKIKNYGQDLALYRDLCQQLSITISRDRFNWGEGRGLPGVPVQNILGGGGG
jgi:hypothetical protein